MTGDVQTVAIVEDDPIIGASLAQRFAIEGIATQWWRSGEEALAGFARYRPQVVVCDIRLPDLDGEALFGRSTRLLGPVPFLFITAFGDIEQAVRLVRAGAVDYITKPFAADELVAKVRDLVAAETARSDGSLGVSPAMRAIEVLLRRVARIDSHVLFLGESGVGKEVCARFLHAVSPRAEGPFVAVNCAAIPAELVESELFGHERGAFTGAVGRHAGFAERAADGCLFLDEVGELPLAAQAKLLRLVQDRSFHPVGAEETRPFDARLVCATNRDLDEAVAQGRFRADLYYRINVLPVRVPPLRERPEDVPPLLTRYLREFAARFEVPVTGLAPAAEEAALEWSWPGNVRELVNRVERAVALAEQPIIGPGDLFPEMVREPASREGHFQTLEEARAAAERRQIERALALTGGRIIETARLLGVSRTTLWEKMRRLGLGPSSG